MEEINNDEITIYNTKNKCRFKVYKKNIVLKDNRIAVRHLIVLCQGKEIIAWTDYHKYFTIGKKRKAICDTSNAGMRPYNISKFLNYIFFEDYHINNLSAITIDMTRDFLNAYGMNELESDSNGRYRKQETVEVCVTHITDFLLELIKKHPRSMQFKKDDLVVKYQYFSERLKKYVEGIKPIFDVKCIGNPFVLYRDIPDKAFNIIMTNIKDKHKDILMLASNSAFAGVRPSESCNVRRIDSPIGPGILFDIVDGCVVNISLDLRYEYKLRSDDIRVGGIKKHRMQEVYPEFIEQYYENYLIYMDYIKDKEYEEKYGPLTINKQGKAMTYASYYGKFKEAVKECIPIMLDSGDPQLILYGTRLQQGVSISPHILRHWFTVQLVLDGCDATELMNWRGDKSVDSALTYLNNKGDIERKYAKANSGIFDIMYAEAERRNKDA